MTTKQKYTTESITVYPIDEERIGREYTTKMQTPNARWKPVGKTALIRVPVLAIIDEEFCGSDLAPDSIVQCSLYKETTIDECHFTHECFPSAQIPFTLAELDTYLLPAVPLAEFTRQRRGYNSRIRGNEAAWLRHFNK